MNYHILDYISDAYIIVNLTTETIEYFNNQAKALLKLPSESVIQISHFFKTKKQWSEFKNNAVSFLAEGTVDFSITQSIHSYDNMIFSAIIKCGYVDDTRKTIYLTFCTVDDSISTVDIDFRIFTEMSVTGFAIIRIDRYLTIKYANESFYKILGIDLEECSSFRSFLSHVYSDDKKILMVDYKEQLKNKAHINLEYRIKTKDNKLKWICFDGNYVKKASGFDEMYCNIKEVREKKEILDKLASEQVFYHIGWETSDDIVFQFTFENDYMEQYGNSVKNFEISSAIENFPNTVIEKGIVIKEDISIFLMLFDNMRRGIIMPLEFRMINSKNNIAWYRAEYKIAFNNDIPVKATGKLHNIQGRKLLEETASTDQLTKCLNKASIEKVITIILQNSNADEQHAFLIIDIDDFKNINDSFGHLCGDFVLSEISQKLRQSFRDNDCVGRIGGDEFVVFLKGISDLSMIIKKADMISKIFGSISFKESSEYKVSGSVGISRFPIDGLFFEDLYKKADIALYNSKDKGKNRYSLYNDNPERHGVMNDTQVELKSKPDLDGETLV